MRWRPTLALAILLLSGCVAAPEGSRTDPMATLPDPLAAGGRSVTRLEYDFGQYVVDDAELAVYRYPVPLHGSIHLPSGTDALPLVILMHGRHVTCDYAGQLEFLGVACPSTPITDPIDSYTGYDGLAELLASHGYVVTSIDANTINDRDLAGDAGANARAAVVLRTLDELASVNSTGRGLGSTGGLPANVPTSTPQRDVSAARGRIDLARVGLMGHSRGGEGVARAVTLDEERFSGAHGLDAVFALAPTDFARWLVPGVAFATLLPYCDGDVFNLQGAAMYDDARRLDPAAPRHQILAMGANHNFYNTVWTGDDWGTRPDPWCQPDTRGHGRDSPGEQRAHGHGLMASFFRLYIGGESQFAPMWDGAGSAFPPSLCPERPSCAGRLHASMMPVRRLDLAADGFPPTRRGLEAERCADAQCPSQPMYSQAAQTAWSCTDGRATFAVPGGTEDWTALSLRVGNIASDAERLALWLEGGDLVASNRPQAGEAALPARPGDPQAEPGAKTVLSEVRFDLPHVLASEVTLRCSGIGSLQVADIMLV